MLVARNFKKITSRSIIQITAEVRYSLIYNTHQMYSCRGKLFHKNMTHFYFQVREALANNQPVVALESTIISHGMPYPRNIEVARDVEAVIRSFGAIPATCAIIDGTLR